jgi:hypothetical protein
MAQLLAAAEVLGDGVYEFLMKPSRLKRFQRLFIGPLSNESSAASAQFLC